MYSAHFQQLASRRLASPLAFRATLKSKKSCSPAEKQPVSGRRPVPNYVHSLQGAI
jgi:hypothetical protein